MSRDGEGQPYLLRTWRKVHDKLDLEHDDIVRVVGTPHHWVVRKREDGKLRLSAADGSEDNVFFDRSVIYLAEHDLLEKPLSAQLQEFDVWANETDAYSYRGGGDWLDLSALIHSHSTFLETASLPDDLALVWRRKDDD